MSTDSPGAVCGIGRPKKEYRAAGTPTVSAMSAMTAAKAASTSPAERVGRAGGAGEARDRRRHQHAAPVVMPNSAHADSVTFTV